MRIFAPFPCQPLPCPVSLPYRPPYPTPFRSKKKKKKKAKTEKRGKDPGFGLFDILQCPQLYHTLLPQPSHPKPTLALSFCPLHPFPLSLKKRNDPGFGFFSILSVLSIDKCTPPSLSSSPPPPPNNQKKKKKPP